MSTKIVNDKLTISINEMIHGCSSTPASPSIYRVSDFLRSTKEKAYESMVVSIGPFHHGKLHLKAMEQVKIRYLKQLVGESSVDTYVNAVRAMARAARACYAEDIEPRDDDQFVEMLLLDGAFVVEFLREYKKRLSGRRDDTTTPVPYFGFGSVVSLIRRDLMLFENQLPLFLLIELFNLSKEPQDKKKLNDLMWPSLWKAQVLDYEDEAGADDDHHLLGLVHRTIRHSFLQETSRSSSDKKMVNIRSATELKEAGIIFKNANNGNTKSWLNITFKNRILYIPEMEVSDSTESWFLNMIAYEFYLPSSEGKYVTDYAFFLHCLIHSAKDAELLRLSGVISNLLGGDARVYEVIDRLGTNVQTSTVFSYSDVFVSMNRQCKLRRNRWLAVLRRKHFSNPWTSISLAAAALLLSVGILQTAFTILSFYSHRS